jgi:hypothetical protein
MTRENQGEVEDEKQRKALSQLRRPNRLLEWSNSVQREVGGGVVAEREVKVKKFVAPGSVLARQA